MKPYFLLAAFLGMLAAVPQGARADEMKNLDDCVVVEKTEEGKLCSASPSVHVTYLNKCSVSVDAQVSLQRASGGWDSGLQQDLKPGEKASYWSCNSTGRVAVSARKAGDENTKFSEPKE